MVFKSGVSLKLFIPVMTTMIFMLFLPFLIGEGLQEIGSMLLYFLIMIPSTWLVYDLFINLRYSLIEGFLVIVPGGILPKTRIPIEAIRKIEKTTSLISSPAASLDRIEVFYNKFDSVVISPENRQEFLQELLKQNPKIQIGV